MNTGTHEYSGLFYRAVAAATMIAPMLLVLAAASRPDGERGSLIVNGLGAWVVMAVSAVMGRAAYSYGSDRALRRAVNSERLRSGYSGGSYAA